MFTIALITYAMSLPKSGPVQQLRKISILSNKYETMKLEKGQHSTKGLVGGGGGFKAPPPSPCHGRVSSEVSNKKKRLIYYSRFFEV
jgi:hypothetical protein